MDANADPEFKTIAQLFKSKVFTPSTNYFNEISSTLSS